MTYTIKQARVLNDLTQAEMAKSMGISRETYRKIEANPRTATIDQAYLIAQITGISIDKIFFADASTKSRCNEEQKNHKEKVI